MVVALNLDSHLSYLVEHIYPGWCSNIKALYDNVFDILAVEKVKIKIDKTLYLLPAQRPSRRETPNPQILSTPTMPPPPTSAPHSLAADDFHTSDTAAAAAGAVVPCAASQPGTNGGKKPAFAFGRVWSEADEVRILEGLAAYAAAHGAEPRRSQLHAALDGCGLDKSEFTVTEIYEKVRRLRTKYANRRSAGGVPVPAAAGGAGDGDEARKYELSRSIWGDLPLKKVGASHATNASGNGNGNANANAAPGTRARRGIEELQGLYPSLASAVEGITDNESLRPVLKRAFQLISDERARQLDAKVKKQRDMEAQMAVKVTALRNEVLDTLTGSMDCFINDVKYEG
jgi:hypothetical protein